MFKNYVTTALRNLFRNKLYSLINIGGLAVGLAVCILIFLFVRDEMSYDNFWADADDIYLLEVEVAVPGRLPETFAVTGAPVKAALEKDFSEIQEITRFFPSHVVVQQGENNYFEHVTFADENFFEIFKLPFVAGSPGATLGDVNSIGISEEMAKKYFGDTNPLNQTLEIMVRGNQKTYRVAGVFEDLPKNTHMYLDMIVLLNREDFLNSDGSTFLDNWGNTSLYTYIKFPPGADVVQFEGDLDAFSDRNGPQSIVDGIGIKVSEFLGLYLTPLGDIYLGGAQSGRLRAGGDLTMVKSFIAIAVLILLTSGFNFINLTTARSLLRTTEISLRKVFGANRKNIIVQFLSETFVIMFIALATALVLVELSLPWFNEFISRVISPEFSSDPLLLFGLFGLLIVVSLGAGFYPSFMVSGFRPLKGLGGGQNKVAISSKMRTFFVVLQFSISIGLIISSAVVYNQTNYVKSLDLGFEKENILVLRGIGRADVSPHVQTLIQQLRQSPEVLSVSASVAVPFDIYNNFQGISFPGAAERGSMPFNSRFIDEAYFTTYDIPIIAGRNFSQNFGTDKAVPAHPDGSNPERMKSGVIINQAAVNSLGLGSAKETLGQVVNWGDRQLEVVGVIGEIHNMPATYQDEPMFYIWAETTMGNLSIRYKTTNLPGFVDFIDRTWKQVVPETPIQQFFLKDHIETAYSNTEAMGTMFGIFSILAILVSGFGLYGLAALTTQQRIREIGVRKVMGASIPGIIKMMIWQFSKPVLLANLVAWPVVWYFLAGWLNGFVYRIDLSPIFFIVGGITALTIAWFTVGGHVFRVARTNPIKALRYE